MGLFNIGSLVLGLVAWVLPIISLLKYRNKTQNSWSMRSILSLSACTIAIYFQVIYHHYLVKIEDWSALMDTAGAVNFVAGVLLVVTILLNGITLVMYTKDRGKKTKKVL